MNHALRSSVRTALAPAVACGGTRYGRGGRPDDLYLYWRCGMRFYAYFRGSRARWRTSQVLYARQSSRFLHFFGESGLLENEPTAPAEQAHTFCYSLHIFVWRFHIFRFVLCVRPDCGLCFYRYFTIQNRLSSFCAQPAERYTVQ